MAHENNAVVNQAPKELDYKAKQIVIKNGERKQEAIVNQSEKSNITNTITVEEVKDIATKTDEKGNSKLDNRFARIFYTEVNVGGTKLTEELWNSVKVGDFLITKNNEIYTVTGKSVVPINQKYLYLSNISVVTIAPSYLAFHQITWRVGAVPSASSKSVETNYLHILSFSKESASGLIYYITTTNYPAVYTQEDDNHIYVNGSLVSVLSIYYEKTVDGQKIVYDVPVLEIIALGVCKFHARNSEGEDIYYTSDEFGTITESIYEY